jgi:anaerobic magnesium-protoporphyrin IX monomethyl ester cyclase
MQASLQSALHAKPREKLDALLVRIRTLNHFTRGYMEDEQLGLLYIATYCRRHGYAVGVLDEYSFTPQLLEKTLSESGARVVGFYCDHENTSAVIRSIQWIKSRSDVLCVAGGPQVSAAPWNARIFAESPVDIAVAGEGEDAFLAILGCFAKQDPALEDIAGISYRVNGGIRTTEPRPPVKDLDRFPFPDRNLNYYGKKMEGAENLVTSRGCPSRCAFCFEGRPVGVRVRSVENVLEEVEMLLRERRMEYVAILDDLFTIDYKRVAAICDGFRALQRKYHKFYWFCEGRVDVISRHPEMAPAMREAGLIRLQIGVESGSQKVLDAYNKGITLDEIRQCVDICYDADILSVVGNVILGGALEDRETFNDTLAFTCELMDRAPGCYDFNTTILTPYPGTAVYETPEKFGLKLLDRDCVTGMGDNYAFAETAALSKWEIMDCRHLFMEAVEAKAASLIGKVSEGRRLRHFRAWYLYGIQTIWFQVFSTQKRLYNYYGLQVSGGKKTVSSVPPEDLGRFKPIRTIGIGSSVDGRLVLPFMQPSLKLSKTGGRILELCCGKLTVDQIVAHLCGEMGNGAPVDRVGEYVRATLAMLDEYKLIVLSEL